MKKRLHVLSADADLQTRLGAIIRACRHKLKITQNELAGRAGLHRTYLADIERGARNLTLRTVANLARTLEISIGHLFAHATASGEITDLAQGEVKEILLVEHHAAAAAATAKAFKRAKLANPLKIVRDGETGLNYLFGTGRYARRKPVRPQLILLVLDLPKMSGTEFLRHIKADDRTHDIPVVILKVSE